MDVFIMIVDTAKPFSEYENYLKYISVKRQKRIERFRFEKDKIISLCSELLIRSELSKILNVCPSEINIENDEKGKPYVSNFENIHFSLSHSGEMILLAVDNSRIGADTEQVKKNHADVAKSFFTNNEYKYISNSENPTKKFYMVWTMKEAYLKMTGEGITSGLDNFDVFSTKFKEMLKTYSYNSKYMIAICRDSWKKEDLKPVIVNLSDLLGCYLP